MCGRMAKLQRQGRPLILREERTVDSHNQVIDDHDALDRIRHKHPCMGGNGRIVKRLAAPGTRLVMWQDSCVLWVVFCSIPCLEFSVPDETDHDRPASLERARSRRSSNLALAQCLHQPSRLPANLYGVVTKPRREVNLIPRWPRCWTSLEHI